jgi:hypothetical protein
MKDWFRELAASRADARVSGGAVALIIVLWLAVLRPCSTGQPSCASVDRKRAAARAISAASRGCRRAAARVGPCGRRCTCSSTARPGAGLQLPRTRQDGPDGVNVTLRERAATR